MNHNYVCRAAHRLNKDSKPPLEALMVGPKADIS